MIIEATIRPYSSREQEIAIGAIINGEFQQDRKLWNVSKDVRLKVARKFSGKGAQTDVAYTISVPANYPLAIALKSKDGGTNGNHFQFKEVFFSPVPAKKDVVLEFGKHAGKKFSEVPAPYLKWLIIHSKVLSVKNRLIVEDVKAFLA
jgi:hypothetical protein